LYNYCKVLPNLIIDYTLNNELKGKLDAARVLILILERRGF